MCRLYSQMHCHVSMLSRSIASEHVGALRRLNVARGLVTKHGEFFVGHTCVLKHKLQTDSVDTCAGSRVSSAVTENLTPLQSSGHPAAPSSCCLSAPAEQEHAGCWVHRVVARKPTQHTANPARTSTRKQCTPSHSSQNTIE